LGSSFSAIFGAEAAEAVTASAVEKNRVKRERRRGPEIMFKDGAGNGG
jgi:hypothetical protein